MSVVVLIAVTAGNRAVDHQRCVALDQLLNLAGVDLAFGRHQHPGRTHQNRVALFQRVHYVLHATGGSQAGVVTAQRLSVGIFDDFRDHELHVFVHSPAITLGEREVIVVRAVVALRVVACPVVLELARCGVGAVPERHLALHAAAVDVVEGLGCTIGNLGAHHPAVPHETALHHASVVGVGRNARS